MSGRLPPDLLYDSEASLRTAAGMLRDLQRIPSIDESDGAPDAHAVPHVPQRAYDELVAVLDLVRRSRSAVERTAMERVARMDENLRQTIMSRQLAYASSTLDDVEARMRRLVELLDSCLPA